MIDIKRVLKAKPKGGRGAALTPLSTTWGDEVRGTALRLPSCSGVPRPEHPNPQCARDAFASLNGWWSCAFVERPYDPQESTRAVCEHAVRPERIDTPILVPFSPETSLSGVGRQLQPDELLWYRTEAALPGWALSAKMRCLLHFEAVDDTCAVWCNGVLLGTHEGGYLPFSFDLTPVLAAFPKRRSMIIDVCVADPSDAGVQLRGKQKLASGDFWYEAQSGIWQPVWIEAVPQTYLEEPRFDADIMEEALTVHVRTHGEGVVSAELWEGDLLVARGKTDTYCEHAELRLEAIKPHLWHPDDPFLYRVVMRLEGADGSVDTVQSYCAWRLAEVRPDGSGGSRFYLNGEPFFLKGVLDQGYWPESLMTAPSDEAFVFDIRQMKACGFNMLRKHVKIEARRFYYHCDRLGMLVWQDMVNGGGAYDEVRTTYVPTLNTRSWHRYPDTDLAHTRPLGGAHRHYRDMWWRTCRRMLEVLGSHPCIVTWVLFNEGWGQFDSAGFARLVQDIDPTRPVEAASGWFDQGAGDYFGVHNYFREQKAYRDWRQRKWRTGRACVTSELGGLVLCVPEHSQVNVGYGFDVYDNLSDWQRATRSLIDSLETLEGEGLSGYVYTQVSDVGEEANGILTADRAVNKLLSPCFS